MAVPSLAVRPAPILLFPVIAALSPLSWGLGAPPGVQGVVMEPRPGSPPTSSGSSKATTPFVEMPAPDEPKKKEEAAVDHGRQSTSSSSSSSSSNGSLSHPDATSLGSTLAPTTPEDEQAAAPEAKPDEWVIWSAETSRTADEFFSTDSGAALPMEPTQAPSVQTMPALDGAAAAGSRGFDPDRIPASVFQPRTSVSQAEWSVASNESLFSIHGARQSVDLGGSRSHFDYFYDEAMAAEQDSKLPPLAEGTESGDAGKVPGSAGSEASHGSAGGSKKAAVIRRHESGSGGSSSNFSFAFPILAEMSPRKKDCVTAALYQPLQKEYEPPMPPPLAAPAPTFVEMTMEEERRQSNGWCCCGCCWFDCSAWPSCCCWCCRSRWWQCGRGRCSCSCPNLCSCSCPNLCRCSWCLCF